MTDEAPALEGVLETVVYHASAQRQEVERFYSQVLGLRRVAGWPDGLAFRIGPGVLLAFDRERLAKRGGPLADHGTRGAGHVCLRAGSDAYETWQQRLAEAGVAIAHEERWPSGLRSFYFQDPAGNLLEVAEGDLWPS